MRLEARIKKAENKLFGKRLVLSSEQLADTIDKFQQFSPEELASAIISCSIRADRFLAFFPLDFQEKVRAELGKLKEARDQDQKGGPGKSPGIYVL